MKLSEKEQQQIEKGLEITFMHLKEIIKHPERLDDFPAGTNFFPVYIKEEGKEALLLGVKPEHISA